MRTAMISAQLACCVAFMVYFGFAKGQSPCSYSVVNPGSYTLQQIEAAFSSASLDSYRMKTQRRSMVFDNGAEVELWSAAEMAAQGCAVDADLVMEDHVVIDPGRYFSLHPSGVIVEVVRARSLTK